MRMVGKQRVGERLHSAYMEIDSEGWGGAAIRASIFGDPGLVEMQVA